MDPDELRRAIELPARRAGLRLESGLSAAMIGEVADEPGGLPLLSCALLESWQHRRGRTLTLAAYHQAGGVHGAVARLAERAWSQPRPRPAADRPPDPAAAGRAGRRRGRGAPPRTPGRVHRKRGPARRAVLDALADQRLLTKSEDTVEVAHEALLREWPRLRGWLEDDVQGRAVHRHLIGAAQEWEQSGRDPGELYRGVRLTGALDWARDHHADLNELERAYLEASRAAAEQEVADARRRAEREARTSRRLRGLLAGLAAVLALALVAGGFAVALRGRADRQTLVAQRQTQVAESRRLAAQVLLQSDLDRSLLLAVEAVRLDDSVDTRSALLTTLLRSPQALRVFRGGGNQLHDLALSPDGRTLAVEDNLGLTNLWDTRTGRRLDFPDKSSVVAFSRDGRLLMNGYPDLLLWDVARRAVVRRLLPPNEDDVVVDAAFSPDGRVLAASTQRGSLIFWDAASGERLGPVLHPYHPDKSGFEVSLAFAHDGATLFTSVQGGKTIVWDVAHRRPVRTFPFGGMLSLSGDSKMLALGRQDGSIVLADAGTGRRRRVLSGHSAAITGLAVSPAGGSLASVSGDRTAILWDVATGTARETLRGHAGSVTDVAFSPDATHAVHQLAGRQRDRPGPDQNPRACPAAHPRRQPRRWGRLQPTRPQPARAGATRWPGHDLGPRQAHPGREPARCHRRVCQRGGVQPRRQHPRRRPCRRHGGAVRRRHTGTTRPAATLIVRTKVCPTLRPRTSTTSRSAQTAGCSRPQATTARRRSGTSLGGPRSAAH